MRAGRPDRAVGGRPARVAPPSCGGAGYAERGGDYSSSSAYEPMARAMSASAQKRWYVNTGAAPPLR